MASLLKISDAAAIGVHATCIIACNPGELLTVGQIAKKLSVSSAHLAKVLQRLARAGLLHSMRGPSGGFQLNRPAEDLTLLDIVECIEGPIRPDCCVLSPARCDGRACIMGALSLHVNNVVREYLSSRKVSDIRTSPNGFIREKLPPRKEVSTPTEG